MIRIVSLLFLFTFSLYGTSCLNSKENSFLDNYLSLIRAPQESKTFCEAYGKFANADYLLVMMLENPKKAKKSGVPLASIKNLHASFGMHVLKFYSPQFSEIWCFYKVTHMENCFANHHITQEFILREMRRIKNIVSNTGPN